jgi:hypothetical protein
MQSMTPYAPVLSDCAAAGAGFGLGAVASVFTVVWKPVSFATASAFLPAVSFAVASLSLAKAPS